MCWPKLSRIHKLLDLCLNYCTRQQHLVIDLALLGNVAKIALRKTSFKDAAMNCSCSTAQIVTQHQALREHILDSAWKIDAGLLRSLAAMAKKGNAKTLSSGRPPNATKPKASLSSQATRTLIRTHHQLNKRLESAKAKGDHAEAEQLRGRIEELGGLKSYQQASIQGQSNDRGGDSSTVLMTWLQPLNQDLSLNEPRLKLLEVGALSTKNACSRSGYFDVERIDLNSQAEGILQQDFMQRPLPKDDKDKFDIISLSLVVNYVPDAAGRGEMLRRTRHFLDMTQHAQKSPEVQSIFPALFLVLPAPCITNSRYMDEARLNAIMQAFGYRLLQRKQTAKLVYYLWHLSQSAVPRALHFPKKEVNPGVTRNNFSITLDKVEDEPR